MLPLVNVMAIRSAGAPAFHKLAMLAMANPLVPRAAIEFLKSALSVPILTVAVEVIFPDLLTMNFLTIKPLALSETNANHKGPLGSFIVSKFPLPWVICCSLYKYLVESTTACTLSSVVFLFSLAVLAVVISKF